VENIQFNAVVGREQVIRPPAGITLPVGEIEVTVRSRQAVESEPNGLEPTREWLLAFAAEAEKAQVCLPSDLAECHDFYAHGKPRP